MFYIINQEIIDIKYIYTKTLFRNKKLKCDI